MGAAYKEILETRDNIIVVGMSSDGLEALEKSAELVPDVAILDVRMPNMDGLAVANRIMAQDTPTAIVLVSAYDDLAFICAIMHSGAARKAYILKNSLDNITSSYSGGGRCQRPVSFAQDNNSKVDGYLP